MVYFIRPVYFTQTEEITVNRDILFIILGKLGFPPRFIKMIKMLYSNAHARHIVDGE